MENAGPPSGPKLDFNDTYRTTFNVLGASFARLFTLSALVVLPSSAIGFFGSLLVHRTTSFGRTADPALVLQNLAVAMPIYFAIIALTLVLYAFGQGAIMFATVQELVGKHASVGESLRVALGRLVPASIVSLLVGFVMAIGLMLCCAPGVIAWVYLCLAVPVCIVERAGVIPSLQRSIELSEGQRMPIFLVYLVAFVVILAASLCVVGPFTLFSASGTTPGELPDPLSAPQLLQQLFSTGISLFTTMFFAVLNAVLYAKLRGLRDGVDAQALARVFE